MMRCARRAALAAVLVAATVSTVSAACAWVLWVKVVELGATTALQVPTQATESRDECVRLLQHALEKERTTIPVPSGTQTSWSCLPDTVDPRGPKAK